MEENKEVNETEQKVDEVAKEVEQKIDRPEVNYKAELERKSREIERMRMELAARDAAPKVKDPNDMRTWPEHELKAVLSTQDPQYAQARDQANEILLDRKVDARLARKEETNKRVTAEMQLRSQFPEALDPASELAIKMDKIIEENDLSKTPAGRLVAAKLAATELNQGKNASDAQGRKKESDRVATVKSQLVDGDRPKPTENKDVNLESKRNELKDGLMDSRHEGRQVDALSKILNDRGFSQDKFFTK